METLETYFATQANRDIHTLARYVEEHVNTNWEAIAEAAYPEMLRLYPQIGDSVYGLYGNHLFKHIHNQLKAIEWRAMPRLPGSFSISREWGDDESDRQRWMWSKITDAEGKAVGTICIIFYHDHLQVRIPRALGVIGLEATSKAAVTAVLGRISPDFAAAQEAKIEIAEYLAQLAGEQSTN